MMYSYMHARNRHKFSYKINTMEINSRHLVRHAGSGYRLVQSYRGARGGGGVRGEGMKNTYAI